MFARQLRNVLERIEQGCLRLIDEHDGEWVFGDPQAELRATVRVQRERFYRRLMLGGDLGAADALLDGDWTADDLTALVRIFIRNRTVLMRLDGGWAWLGQLAARCGHWLRRNTPRRAKRNIREHYDLSNDFFQLFLDETLCYSCGIFGAGDDSLLTASENKLDRACRKLDLSPDDHLLEIGTGWGGLAIHAAETFGCRVTTTTISAEQHRFARERFHRSGLESRIRVLDQDYRNLSGQFDKLVSIEMIEAVGHEFLDTYFRQCSRLLKHDGAMSLQAIVISDQVEAAHLRSVDFVARYIFPGGCLPSIGSICGSVARATDMRLVHLEDFSAHYARTLLMWRERFWSHIAAVRQLGFDDRFIRMWDYYLCYCAAAFSERQVNLVQMVLAKPQSRIDPASMHLPRVAAIGDMPDLPSAPSSPRIWPQPTCSGPALAEQAAV